MEGVEREKAIGGERELEKLWHSFLAGAKEFANATEQFASEGINPGDYYQAVWCRDAAYILRDWFLSGRFEDVMHELLFIWSHQISPIGEKVIYGRGSPELQFRPRVASVQVHEKFQGALPTTIFHGFSEVYGQNPDIDSTALMISSTSWILDAYRKSGMNIPPFMPESSRGELKMSSVVSTPSTVIDYVVPKMLSAIDYLASRDTDGDGLLEQGRNEDWMDTVLRTGKVVYSQACWILALKNVSSLLKELRMDAEAGKTRSMALKAIRAVEETLWSEDDGTYIDWQDEKKSRALTQDVVLYIVALTENPVSGGLRSGNRAGGDGGDGSSISGNSAYGNDNKFASSSCVERANRALDTIQKRIWKNEWPLVTETALDRTGPWDLQPNQYHNHTLWPWATGLEMLARSRLGRVQECKSLLEILFSKDSQSNIRALYEWVNPITDKASGAHPFRTGISTIRIAITDIFSQVEKTRLRNAD